MKHYLHAQLTTSQVAFATLIFYFVDNKTIYCYTEELSKTSELTVKLISRTLDVQEFAESLTPAQCEKVSYDLFLEILENDNKCTSEEKHDVVKRLRGIRLTNII
jgi:hypothetical protein